MNYRALIVRETENGFTKAVETVDESFLPENEVLIKVEAAGLNYKDALSASGHKGISRNFPHTPGVDAAGKVVDDSTGSFSPGDMVICTSYDLGMNTKGGFAEYIRVPAKWVVKMPAGWTSYQSMVLGTAAYTAALALYKMEMAGQHPGLGPIVVTGATGGVGSMAVNILSKAGYEVWAATGKTSEHSYLKSLGASKILSREDVNDTSSRPLFKPEWAGAIDNVGGTTLSTLIRNCGRNGNVATIGLVDNEKLDLTIYPFILNGVNLLGIDSAETPVDLRQKIWNKLASDWLPEHWENAGKRAKIEDIPSYMDQILQGETTGRIVAMLD